MGIYRPTASYRLIYVYRINDEAHRGWLKVGETTVGGTVSAAELPENAEELREAARRRIDQQTKTAGVAYELLHAEVAVRMGEKGQPVSFGDRDVHKMLTGSGVERMKFPQGKGHSEWFRAGLDTVKEAIRAVKEGRTVMAVGGGGADPIEFRPEQSDAIARTCRLFRRRKRMLWNAKMRFGKTLCALEVVRRCGYRRTIILTHRPVVSDGWFEDFRKIFGDGGAEYHFGSRVGKGYALEELVRSGKPFVYFASLQDLRGSASVGGDFDKNELAFQTEWDCVIIDEAHEGTKTALGEKVLRAVVKAESRELHLSGTPFNLQEEFGEEETYTWDYADEQKAKAEWEAERGFELNPYADLPRLNILTYDLNDDLAGYEDTRDSAFNFREFFRVWTGEEQRDGIGGENEVPGGNGGRRTTVGGGADAKYEVRSTKYEVEIPRNSVAQGGELEGNEVPGVNGERRRRAKEPPGICRRYSACSPREALTAR